MAKNISFNHQLHDEDDEISDDGDGADASQVPGDEPEGVLGGPAEARAENRHLSRSKFFLALGEVTPSIC